MRRLAVDTNVAIVANGESEVDTRCTVNCIDALSSIVSGESVLLLDRLGHILDEYLRQRPHGYPQGPGDQFMIWAVTNQANPDCCTQVAITIHPERGYTEFPEDPLLESFDRSDRKFVAVAIVHGRESAILNATDSDWRNSREALARHVQVTELCLQEHGQDIR
jgi:hypothetical protein